MRLSHLTYDDKKKNARIRILVRLFVRSILEEFSEVVNK